MTFVPMTSGKCTIQKCIESWEDTADGDLLWHVVMDVSGDIVAVYVCDHCGYVYETISKTQIEIALNQPPYEYEETIPLPPSPSEEMKTIGSIWADGLAEGVSKGVYTPDAIRKFFEMESEPPF